jgi:hypothetical protein
MAIDGTLHKSMSRLVGTWRTEGRIVDGGEHDGATWAGHDIYEWFPGEQQMVHRVDVEIFGGRKEAMEFFTPRPGSRDTFDQVSFDADGTVEQAVGVVDADGRYRNDTDGARAVLTFDGPDSMSAKWERREPDGTWIDWMQVTFARIAAPHIEVRSKDDHSV